MIQLITDPESRLMANIPSYNGVFQRSDKDLLIEYNALRYRNFADVGTKPGTELQMYEPSSAPWYLHQQDPVVLTKERIYFKNEENKELPEESLDLIYKNGKFFSFALHTKDPSVIFTLVQANSINPYSLTTKAIAALGEYQEIVLEGIAKGYLSNRHNEKRALLKLYQDRIGHLCGLESLANKENTLDSYKKTFEVYINELKQIQENCHAQAEVKFEGTDYKPEGYFYGTDYEAIDPKAFEFIHNKIAADIKAAQEKLEEITKATNLSSYQRSTGYNSILTFVKTQLAPTLREMQGQNQILSYSTEKGFAATRGDLSICIDDAILCIAEHEADPHNPILAEDHHLDFSNSKGVFCVDSVSQGFTDKQTKKALLAISFIKDLNVLKDGIVSKYSTTDINAKPSLHELQVVRSPKWNSRGGLPVTLKKIAVWLPNVVYRIVSGVVDLVFFSPVYLLAHIFKHNQRLKAAAKTCSEIATYEITVDEPEYITDLRKKMHHHPESFGQRLVHFVVNLARNSIGDILSALKEAATELTFSLYRYVRDDIAAAKEITDSATLYLALDQQLDSIATYNHNQSHKFVTEMKDKYINNLFIDAIQAACQYAGNTIYTRLTKEDAITLQQITLEEVLAAQDFIKLLKSKNIIFLDIHINDLISAFTKIRDIHNEGKNKEAVRDEKVPNDEKQKTFKTFPTRQEVLVESKNRKEKVVAPAYLPGNGEWEDIVSKGIAGTQGFLTVFMHRIYTNNPFAGLLFTAGFVAGGLPIIAPQLFASSPFKAAVAKMGQGMAKGSLEQSIGVGSTFAEGAAPLWQFLLNGPGSWLADFAANFEQDPATIMAYTAMAYGLGFFLVYGGIPGISATFAEAMGTVPAATILFAGAKVGLLIFELLHTPDDDHLLKKQKSDELKVALAEYFIALDPSISEEALATAVEEKYQHIITSIEKDERYKIVKRIYHKHQDLQYLSPAMKNQFARQIDTVFVAEPLTASALKVALYPEKPRSILHRTVSVLIAFPVLILRVLIAIGASIATRSFKPLKAALHDLGEHTLKTIARVYRGISKIVKMSAYFIRVMLKSNLDVLGNSLLARPIAYITGILFDSKKVYPHHMTHAMYNASAKFDAAYETARQTTFGVDMLVERVTKPQVAVGCMKCSSALVTSQLPKLPPLLTANGRAKVEPESTTQNNNADIEETVQHNIADLDDSIVRPQSQNPGPEIDPLLLHSPVFNKDTPLDTATHAFQNN